MLTCPRCTQRLQRSRIRSTWETCRRALTGRRPYRCHGCNWRGWRADAVDDVEASSWSAAELATDVKLENAPRKELDLDALDAMLQSARRSSRRDPPLIG